MNATETFEQLNKDFEKTLTALLNVRTIHGIHFERTLPNYVYNQDKSLHEYWIALGQYSVSSNLSLLAFVINSREEFLSTNLQSRQDIIDYCASFENNKEKIIAAFDNIIGNPNLLFIGYSEPITMEQYLQRVISSIHDEALNLEYNYKQYKSLIP